MEVERVLLFEEECKARGLGKDLRSDYFDVLNAVMRLLYVESGIRFNPSVFTAILDAIRAARTR